MAKAFKTREQWLQAFTAKARPLFKRNGFPIPVNVRMAVGYTSAGLRSNRIGECWAAETSADKSFEIFVSPKLADPRRVAGVLTHELIHASVGIANGHNRTFGKVARALGLEGPLTATKEGPTFYSWADPIIEKLGPLPHAEHFGDRYALPVPPKGKGPELPRIISTAPPKQSTRLIKCECGECGLVFRTTRRWLASAICCPDPTCRGTMRHAA